MSQKQRSCDSRSSHFVLFLYYYGILLTFQNIYGIIAACLVYFFAGGAISMTINEMKERKRELGLSNEEISKRTGIPVSTLQKVFSGKTKSPRQQTITALENVLLPSSERHYTTLPRRTLSDTPYYFPSNPTGYSDGSIKNASFLADPSAAYMAKKQGEYTLEDYYALPDERRVELIDGVLYDMSSPSYLHQKILGELYLQFEACAAAHGSECEVYLAPCDVRLDADNKTIIQPDLFIICKDFDRTARAYPGAPDFVVEILSPSTRSKDMTLKLMKYHNAGVREYWLVDPKNKIVICYTFSDPDYKPEIYPFDSEIPISISEGKCSIDFRKINNKLAPFYEPSQQS